MTDLERYPVVEVGFDLRSGKEFVTIDGRVVLERAEHGFGEIDLLIDLIRETSGLGPVVIKRVYRP